MENALVTGGTGPLGIALIELLISKGVSVTAITRADSSRIARIPSDANIIYAELSELSNVDCDSKFDTFFHLGWAKTANHDERSDIGSQFANIRYSLDAVDLAHRLGCSVFVGAGSQSEYGDINNTISEFTPTNPIEPYGIAKLSASLFCGKLCEKYGIKFGWLRILSMFGMYDRETTFVSYVMNELREGRSPKLTKCEQEWDYIYAKDAARAFYLLVEKGKPNAIYPLASGVSMPLRRYAEIIRDTIASDVALGFGEIPYPQGQRMNLTADISALKRDLGVEPEYSFRQGIREMLRSYENTEWNTK